MSCVFLNTQVREEEGGGAVRRSPPGGELDQISNRPADSNNSEGLLGSDYQ